jgi:hypothetical protein
VCHRGDASAPCRSCRVAAQGWLSQRWVQLEAWLIQASSKAGWGYLAGEA